jgi:8-oxo-dGTP pyrophosphatase MutT (NUDIX family)
MKTPLFDPNLATIDALAGEAPVDAHRLSPAWLRERFTQSLAWTPEFTEDAAWRDLPPDAVPAAVLIPLVNRPQGMTLLLTLRTAHLNDHAGQISFPGGRVDPEDRDPIATALRETEEEAGLSRQHIEVIGTLPDYLTGTGFRVTPVVALVQPPFELAADVFEVAEIFEVPLDFLMNGANHQRRSAEFPNRPGRRSFYAMPFEHYFIWGATAAMLRNLYHFLRA